MPFRVVDPDYEKQALEEIKKCLPPEGAPQPVVYQVCLPLLLHSAEEPLPCHEPASETTAISAHVSARIHAFYEQLAAYYHAESPRMPEDEEAPGGGGVSIGICVRPQAFDGEDPYCGHRKYHSRRLQLHDPATLPDLPFVTSLTVESKPDYGGDGWESYGVRPLSPLVPLRCLARLPAVEELTLPWMWERPMPCCMPSRVAREHYTRPWEGPLRDARHEFGAALLSPEEHLGGRPIPASLTRAALHFWTPRQIPEEDQAVPRPNLIAPAGKDPVSVGLRRLAAQLHVLDVRALITEDLFPPPGASTGEQWSQMRRLRIEFHPLRPDGRWYFVGPRGEDPHDSAEEGGFPISDAEHYPREHDTEEDQDLDEEWEDDPNGGAEADRMPDLFRTQPCRERIEPLLAAFARALTHDRMPRLEDAEMFAFLWWHPSHRRAEEYGIDRESAIETDVHRWGVKYVAGRDGKGGDAAAPTVQWQVGDWRPSQEVLALFEALGQQEWLPLEPAKQRYHGDFTMSLKNKLF
ncbi:hypothetical protein IF1G_08563 [Cordyceps javanica]|uniref:Uncharacterized protein n=1 Tax=Cordyceps javanica TaxID=43265 RepID=A0A545VNV1_9HYPO|nr:hypothetical protein IF1G_08563 [Cordyceps javanica]TQW03401.1 hypothetical protein IF2G_09130 [Cordyceps javanica]